MKFFVILTLIGFMDSCNVENSRPIVEIIYEAHTRGSSVIIKVRPDRLFYHTDNSETITDIKTRQWNSLMSMCSEIDLEKISELQAPSDKRFLDMAMHANLTIVTRNGEFKSQTFDHGNPPEELKKITDKLMKLAKIDD